MIEVTSFDEEYDDGEHLSMMTGDRTQAVFGVQACQNAHIMLSEVPMLCHELPSA